MILSTAFGKKTDDTDDDDVETSPSVTLSPNAQNFVYFRNTRSVTVTVKLQVAERAIASVIVHVTVEVPIGKLAPEVALQDAVVGGVPPLVTGAANVATADVSVVVNAMLAGHVITGSVTGGGTGTGVGEVLGLPHATAHDAARPRTNLRIRET